MRAVLTITPKMAASILKELTAKCPLNYVAVCLKRDKLKSNFDCTELKTASRFKSTANESSSVQYCVDLVKKCDHENYLCTLLYPNRYRTSAFALRALYTELALVQDVTSDNMRAVMRLQFWKDTIDNIFKGTPPKTPVAIEVAKALEKHKLSKIWLTRIVEARAQQINKDVNRSLQEVEDAGESTVSALSYLLLEAAGVKNVHADHAVSHLGRCHSLVTLLRATPYHASRRKIYLPIELLIKHKVSQEDILRGKDEQNVRDVMYDIASRAHQQLETARSLKKDVPREAYPVLMNSVICEQYLKTLQLANFNVFDQGLNAKNAKLPLLLWKQKFIRRTY